MPRCLYGLLSFYSGDCQEAREHLEQCLAVYNPQQHSSHILLYGQDPGVCGLSLEACLLWLLGYPEQAEQQSRDALALAESLSHPFSHALALNFAADLAQFRRDAPEAQARAEALMDMAQEQGFEYWAAQGAIVQGWALAEQNHVDEGITQTRQGLDALQATGAALDFPRYLGLLAEGYGKRGQTEEGLKTLADALARVNRTGERYWEAELHRLQGELTLQQFNVQGSRFKVAPSPTPNAQHPAPSTQEAEACFLTAIEIARQQQAKSLELRAATSLARLWHGQGKQTEARQLLAEVYGWFSEGFDTADLQAAKALLDTLS